MKKRELESFYLAYETEFLHYLEDILFELENTDPHYKEIIRQIEAELELHPNVRRILEEKEIVNLDGQEFLALFNVLNLYGEKRDMEMKEIFFRGGGHAYYYLKRMGILKYFDSLTK